MVSLGFSFFLMALVSCLNIFFFFENVMQEALHDHHGKPIYNLCFVDDIDVVAGTITKPQDLTSRLIVRKHKEWRVALRINNS